MIDTIVIVLVMLLLANIFDWFGDIPDWVRIAAFAGLLLYEPVCTTLGGTIGNRMKGIRVRKESDTKTRISFIHALIRYAVKIILGWVSFITIHSNRKKQAIHDQAAGSVMIKNG